NPPISPSHTSGVGRRARPVIHPSKAISIGTVATSTEASPVGTHFSEIVTPPLPQSRRQPPMMKALRQVTLVGGRRATNACADVHDYTRRKKTRACHEKRGNRLDG